MRPFGSVNPARMRLLYFVCSLMLIAFLVAGFFVFSHMKAVVNAADHRESPTADANPEGDITDMFAFLDPGDSSQLVLIMDVNPFSVPAEASSYSFSTEFLYQFKFNNDKFSDEDLVIQAVFDTVPATTCASGQSVKILGPAHPEIRGAKNRILHGHPTAQGCTNTIFSQGGIKVFTGQQDDPFVTDVGQLFRIKANLQDVFRGFTSPVLGSLRGRPVRPDGTSGVDGFGGFNVSSIAIELPKSLVRGSGFLGNPHLLGIWGTVSRPDSGHEDWSWGKHEQTFIQFQRVGQQLFKTIFVPADQREAFNASSPAGDTFNYPSLVPDALTTTDNDGTGNTIAGRVAVLNAVGVTTAPNGAPLLLPANFQNTSKNLLRVALLPDVLRIDLDRPETDLALGQFGLQNGRRPGDTVTEILMRLARQLADVKFPNGAGVPGSGPLGSRAALDCSVLPRCPDFRVLVVLQGTQFIKADSDLADLTTSGNDLPFSSTFPFLAAPHPLPGQPGTVDFPVQQ